MSAAEVIRAQALEVAAGWSPDGAPESWRLTAGLFGVIAAHEELLGRPAAPSAGRLPALLASAASSQVWACPSRRTALMTPITARMTNRPAQYQELSPRSSA